ncbi:putative protein CXorf58 [Cladochytrium tenue]|nr:putative protein CXorf58 [Cladochytrium tenue]
MQQPQTAPAGRFLSFQLGARSTSPPGSAAAARPATTPLVAPRSVSVAVGDSGGADVRQSRTRALSRTMSVASRGATSLDDARPLTPEDVAEVVAFLTHGDSAGAGGGGRGRGATNGRAVTQEGVRVALERWFPGAPPKLVKMLCSGGAKDVATTEFLVNLLVRKRCPDDYFTDAFQMFDTEEDGALTDEMLLRIIGRVSRYGIPEKGDLEYVRRHLDRDGDGKGGGQPPDGFWERIDRLHRAATTIARAWRSCLRRRVFRSLKHNLYRAERAMAAEILRRVSPREAEFLLDHVSQPRVRFRFGGTTFPPQMYYKVFAQGRKIQHISGESIFVSGSKAAKDACKVMGVRLFRELVATSTSMPDKVDVINRMEYVQYSNYLDELPARLGGRNNGWRLLRLDNLHSPEVTIEGRTAPPLPTQTRKTRRRRPRPEAVATTNGRRGDRVAQEAAVLMSHFDGVGDIGDGGERDEDEDDFGALFEWANGLDPDDFLADFEVVGVLAAQTLRSVSPPSAHVHNIVKMRLSLAATTALLAAAAAATAATADPLAASVTIICPALVCPDGGVAALVVAADTSTDSASALTTEATATCLCNPAAQSTPASPGATTTSTSSTADSASSSASVSATSTATGSLTASASSASSASTSKATTSGAVGITARGGWGATIVASAFGVVASVLSAAVASARA